MSWAGCGLRIVPSFFQTRQHEASPSTTTRSRLLEETGLSRRAPPNQLLRIHRAGSEHPLGSFAAFTLASSTPRQNGDMPNFLEASEADYVAVAAPLVP